MESAFLKLKIHCNRSVTAEGCAGWRLIGVYNPDVAEHSVQGRSWRQEGCGKPHTGDRKGFGPQFLHHQYYYRSITFRLSCLPAPGFALSNMTWLVLHKTLNWRHSRLQSGLHWARTGWAEAPATSSNFILKSGARLQHSTTPWKYSALMSWKQTAIFHLGKNPCTHPNIPHGINPTANTTFHLTELQRSLKQRQGYFLS